MIEYPKYIFRVWVGKGRTKRCVLIKACNGVEARIIAKQQYPNESVGAVWRVSI